MTLVFRAEVVVAGITLYSDWTPYSPEAVKYFADQAIRCDIPQAKVQFCTQEQLDETEELLSS